MVRQKKKKNIQKIQIHNRFSVLRGDRGTSGTAWRGGRVLGHLGEHVFDLKSPCKASTAACICNSRFSHNSFAHATKNAFKQKKHIKIVF